MKAEEEAIMSLLTAKTSAIHKVTAKPKCKACPSNRCPDCPHFGINTDSLQLISSESPMLPYGKNSGKEWRLANAEEGELVA